MPPKYFPVSISWRRVRLDGIAYPEMLLLDAEGVHYVTVLAGNAVLERLPVAWTTRARVPSAQSEQTMHLYAQCTMPLCRQ